MKVVNISRQQKAVCTRDQRHLVDLERHYSRQSHQELYKHAGLIEKFKQKLTRLNHLRMPRGNDYSHTASSHSNNFPIPCNNTNAVAYRNIGKPSTSVDQSTRIKLAKITNNFNSDIHSVSLNKKVHYNNGDISSSVNNADIGRKSNQSCVANNLSTCSYLPHLYSGSRLNIKSAIKQGQHSVDYTSIGYQALDRSLKHFKSFERNLGDNKVTHTTNNGNISVDNDVQTESVILSNVKNIPNYTTNTNTTPKDIDKTVRFTELTGSEISGEKIRHLHRRYSREKMSNLINLSRNTTRIKK